MNEVEKRAFLAYTEKLTTGLGFNESETIDLMKFFVKKLIALHSKDFNDKSEEDFLFRCISVLSTWTVHKENWGTVLGFKRSSGKPFPEALKAFLKTLDTLNWSNRKPL